MQLIVYAESQYELSVLSSSMQFSTSPLSCPLTDSELVNTTPVDHSTPHRHSKRKRSCLLPPSSSVASLTLDSTQTSRTFIDFHSTSCCEKRCLKNLSVAEVQRSRERFNSKITTEQKQFLLDSFQLTNRMNTTSMSDPVKVKFCVVMHSPQC